MSAHDGKERGVLEPASVKFWVIVVTAHIVARIRRIEQRRMSGVMFRRQILVATSVVGPVGDAGGSEVKASRNLALQRVPRRINVGGPNDGAIALHPQVSIAGENQRALSRLVLAETVVKRRGVKELINVEVLRAWTNLKIRAIGR